MDIGKDVLTRTIIGTTDSEKVFTPWWISLHHYLVYTLVVLGLIAVPLNCMLGVHGNCSYDLSNPYNYLYPNMICKIDNATNIIMIEKYYCSPQLRKSINDTFHIKYFMQDKLFEYFEVNLVDKVIKLRNITLRGDHIKNFNGCLVKPDPRLNSWHVYYHCVSHLGVLALYFPYLVLTLSLVLVLLERLLTRFLWTGQRIDKFYNLLVKNVLDSGDIEIIDTKENKQKCQQILYDFKNSSFFCKAYVIQILIKICVCSLVFGWSLKGQCNHLLRDSFRSVLNCEVFGYMHQCSIPSNGMNMIIFDLVNVILFMIIIVALLNFCWHSRFYSRKNYDFPYFRTQLGQILKVYEVTHIDSSLVRTYRSSPDLQMLLNLLAEKEGIWSALLILSLFDKTFREELKVCDSRISSTQSSFSSRRKDIQICWNEPRAAYLLSRVNSDHLMYVLEIKPPLDNSDNDVYMMPVCTENGGCEFNRVDVRERIKSSSKSKDQIDDDSISSRRDSTNSNDPDREISIVEPQPVSISSTKGYDDKKERHSHLQHRSSSGFLSMIKRKSTTVLIGRKQSEDIIRNHTSTFKGLRSDIEYVLSISFVLSGRKLGSESFTILSREKRKESLTPSIHSPMITPVTKIQNEDDSMSSIMNITSTDFKKCLYENCTDKELIVLEFVGSWCGLCKSITKEMENMAESFRDISTFIRADIEDCGDIAKEYGIEVLPSILIFETYPSTTLIETFIGNKTQDIRNYLDNYTLEKKPIKTTSIDNIDEHNNNIIFNNDDVVKNDDIQFRFNLMKKVMKS